MNRPDLKRLWLLSGGIGVGLWLLGLILWAQGGVDEWALFLFDPLRVAGAPLVRVAKLLSGYGMTAITALCVLYYLGQRCLRAWEAPETIYLYVIFSFGFSGIVGDLLKMVFSRPRPVAVFGDQILALSDAVSHAIPSGHATKAMALALPVLFLVSLRPFGQGIWKWVVCLIALGVAVSRVVLGAHYLSDVVAGAGMAFLGFPVAVALAHRILGNVPADRLPGMARKWVVVLAALSVGLLFL